MRPAPPHTSGKPKGRSWLGGLLVALLFALIAGCLAVAPGVAHAATSAAPAADDTTPAPNNPLSLTDAILLGVVEGITEYLPVSSTGHLLLTERVLGISGDAELKTAADSYAIAIQFGAILAVLLLY